MKLLHQGNQSFMLFLSQSDSHLNYPMHLHNAVELVYMLEGGASVFYDNRYVRLGAGELFFAFPNQVHGYQFDLQSSRLVMIVPMQYLSDYRELLETKLPTDPFLRVGQWEHSKLPLLLQLTMEDSGNTVTSVTQGYISVIIGKLLHLLPLADAPVCNPDALQTLLLYLNHNYTRPLTRKDISAAVGYNESYVSHLFTDALHTTLTDYLTSMRIGDAVDLLAKSDLSISQIALSLGFGSIRSFNRAFFKHLHTTPTGYRAGRRQA